jgi:hypothetical protein
MPQRSRFLADSAGKWHVLARNGRPSNCRSSQQAGNSVVAKINHVAIISETYALLASPLIAVRGPH